MKPFILATAGHVDHGKSALVEALTGVHPDRLPEERERGLTIDLGFGRLDLCSPDEPGTIYRIGVIDVPGHEDFVRNMVAGVGSVDLALLAVAADDGWMPQSEEHLQILEYLRVTHAVVALTKADLQPDLSGTTAEIRQRLAGTAFAGAPIVPVSIVNGRGFDALRAALIAVMRTLAPVLDIGKPRLSVDRSFSRKGIGTVVTGTLTGGVLRRGQALVIQPSGWPVRVRSLQNHGRDVDFSPPGTRTALALTDLPPEGIHRGDTITLPGLGHASATLDAMVVRSPRLSPGRSPAISLKSGSLVWVCHGTASAPARVVFLAPDQTLAPGESGCVQLRFEKPVYAWLGDRFILRDAANQITLAGGTILEPQGNRRRFRRGDHREWLAEVIKDPANPVHVARALLKRDRVLRRADLLAAARFSAAETGAAVAQLATEAAAVLTETYALDADWRQEQRRRAQNRIDAEHRLHPESAGLPLVGLRKELPPVFAEPELFSALLAALADAGYTRTGERISRRTHHRTLPAHLQAACNRVQATLLDNPLEPPSRSILTPDPASQAALRYLRDQGDVVELSQEIYLPRLGYARLKKAVTRHLETHGSATASELRQALGTTRRILIPLLEKLDRDGVTRREGDRRKLR
ncbi:MAG: selenocysteine-specific translation elongation factor [Verrucomicrobia bacterium]|nr:selenocysteine-specific translation elongation factor [Verrucomicrobiota bacterium]